MFWTVIFVLSPEGDFENMQYLGWSFFDNICGLVAVTYCHKEFNLGCGKGSLYQPLDAIRINISCVPIFVC